MQNVEAALASMMVPLNLGLELTPKNPAPSPAPLLASIRLSSITGPDSRAKMPAPSPPRQLYWTVVDPWSAEETQAPSARFSETDVRWMCGEERSRCRPVPWRVAWLP